MNLDSLQGNITRHKLEPEVTIEITFDGKAHTDCLYRAKDGISLRLE